MSLTPNQVKDLIFAGFDLYFTDCPPPWYIRPTLAAIDAFFASYYPTPVDETDVDENIMEKLKALPSVGPTAKFDSEGKFSY